MAKILDCNITVDEIKEILWQNLLLSKKVQVLGKRIDELDPLTPEQLEQQVQQQRQAEPLPVPKVGAGSEGGNGAGND